MFHYVDDFVILGPPNSVKCGSDLGLLMQACTELGVLVADDKTEGPSPCLTILGIEVDSLAMELRLPQVKMSRLVHALAAYVAGQALGQAQGLGVSCGFAPTRLASRPPGQSIFAALVQSPRPDRFLRTAFFGAPQRRSPGGHRVVGDLPHNLERNVHLATSMSQ